MGSPCGIPGCGESGICGMCSKTEAAHEHEAFRQTLEAARQRISTKPAGPLPEIMLVEQPVYDAEFRAKCWHPENKLATASLGSSGMLSTMCHRCGQRRAMVRVDLFLDTSPDKKQAIECMADALALGRYEDAIAIYLDNHWEKVQEVQARLRRDR